MKQIFTKLMTMVVLLAGTLSLNAQQLPDPGFEDWSGTKFNSEIQPKYWHYSNLEQFGYRLNYAHRETGRSGYCAMVQNQDIMGNISPGYFTLGTPWTYVASLTQISAGTGGTDGGIDFKYRPDSMYVWIKRTGSAVTKEPFSLLFYSWKGTAQGSKYKGKNGSTCTPVSHTNEESDVRQALDANACGTDTKATQVAEGLYFEKKEYGAWTQIKVPIYYMNDEVPTKANVIFASAGYPNFRAADGMNTNNPLYVDDVELIYSSKIQQLYIGGKVWNGFNPNTSEEQVYSVGKTTVVPEIYAVRGAGTLKNIRGDQVTAPGRKLSSDEITISYGTVGGAPTVITVKSGDGKSTTTYKIKMVQDKSSNATLSSILVNDNAISGFNPQLATYDVSLPYGTTAAPVVSVVKAEDAQQVVITQATSPTGKATIKVTAEDGTTTKTYTINFSIAPLADNTLVGIKVNGKDLPDFAPTQTTYRVELPLGTSTMPTVKAVSAYPAGAQTIVYTAPTTIDGGQYKISVTTPGNQTAKVYKLNFKITASTYSKLADLKMGNYIDFDPNTLTYYVSLPKGTTALPEITYVKGDDYQTVTIENGGVSGTTTITVVPASGEKDKTVYRIICSIEKSNISYLNAIYVDGKLIENFSSDVLKYTVVLPTGTTTIPAITYEKGDASETVQVTEGRVNETTYLSVIAEDGSSTMYEIYFSAPVANVSTLTMITIGGVDLEGFEPNKTEYTITLPQGTTELPAIGYTKNDDFQTVTVRSNGVNGDTKITVRSQAGTQTIYVLHFSVTTSANTKLAWVKFDGVLFADFDPEVREYDIALGEGVSQVPAVSFEKGEPSQKVVGTLEGTTYTIRVISESGAQGLYVFRFTIQKSENAFLNNIYLNGTPLEGFEKEKLVYDVVLTTNTCPTITVDKDPSQHVLITAPAATGTARIVVTPESGAPNTYIINFTSDILPQLTQIYANAEPILGFTPTTYEYEVSYSGQLPTITFDKADEAINTNLVTDATHARIYVEAGGIEKVYELTFVPVYSTDATLLLLAANGTPVAGFASNKFNYSIPLPENGEIPVISYICAEKAHVVAGQSGKYAYSLMVIAESGATQTYTINFTTGASAVTALNEVTLDGSPVTFDGNNTSSQDIEPGKDLPELAYDKRDDQSVITAQTGAHQQQIIVVAEDGTTGTYTINYNETQVVNALLNDIHVQIGEKWQSLEGFDENTFSYNVTLPLGTTVAPCVWPVAGKPGQVITVTYGAANGATTIHVVAPNAEEKDYTVNFAVTKSSNNKLKSLVIDGADYSVDETTIIIDVPFATTEPYTVEYEKAEDSQLIEYKSAPVTEKSEIIVTAENGDKRTYTIEYKFPELSNENGLNKINYSYVNASGETIEGSLVPTKADETVDLPFGAKSFAVTGYEKKSAEQTVVFYNGGIRRGATLLVSANNDKVDDMTYTVTPVMPEFDTKGKLQSLKFKGVEVPNFKPYVYNYMVNVTAEPTAADFTGVAYNGATVTKSALNTTKKQITLSVQGGETYSICWFYENDEPPFHFNWVATASAPFYSFSTIGRRSTSGNKSVGYKPQYWMVPADYTSGCTYNAVVSTMGYDAGMEIVNGGETGIILSSVRGAALNSSMPGVFTLGSLSIDVGINGGTTIKVNRTAGLGYDFRNTPNRFEVDYLPLNNTKITAWNGWITVSNGSSQRVKAFSGTYSTHKWQTTGVDLDYGTMTMSKFNIAIASDEMTNTTNGNTSTSCTIDTHGGSDIYNASLQLRDLRFIYNSELTAVTVNGKTTTKSGNTFTLNLAAGDEMIGVPALKFTGAVHDQTQVIRWKNNGEWINGVLEAEVTNFGENSIDSTVYKVQIKRAAVTDLSYKRGAFKRNGITYPTTISNDTVYINLPFGTKLMPDLDITSNSIHQRIAIAKKSNQVKVTVTNENNAKQDTVYVFREVKAAEPVLANLSVVGASLTPSFAPATTDYTVTATEMPQVNFLKPRSAEAFGYAEELDLGQTVTLKYTANGATVTVKTADGDAKAYNITLQKPAIAPNGTLATITRNGETLNGFKSDTRAYEARMSENIGFVRKQQTDGIVQTITDEYVAIKVDGVDEPYKITYPTEASNNAKLGDILINGVHYDKFNPDRETYDYETDEQVDIKFILSEADVQTMEITISNGAGAPTRKVAARSTVTVFTVKVIAENGDTKTYTFNLRPESSSVNALAGISVAGEPLADFYPEKTEYAYVIPSATPKLAEPEIPSVGYTLGQESQTVTIEPATKLGEPTSIFVTPEDGIDIREYRITFTSKPSNSAELKGILINGKPVSGFKPSRTNYSMQVLGEQVTVDYTLGDPFQTVLVNKTDELVELIVTAQDGTQRTYEVEIWRAAKSDNANLADILLNGESMAVYADKHGIEDLAFKEKTYSYVIPLLINDTMPDIAASLQEDAQTIEVLTSVTAKGTVKTLRVTAEDGVATNDYELLFAREKSSNTHLSMILIKGDSLTTFDENVFDYVINLPIGETTIPSVDAYKSEPVTQQLTATTSYDGKRTELLVTAEDGSEDTYTVTFNFTYSAVDTLKGIYVGDELIAGFRADSTYYAYTLPMGERIIPRPDFEPGDNYQKPQRVDTIATKYRTTYQCLVTAHDELHTRLYTVVYEIQPSNVDTLRSIYVNSGSGKRMLEGFSADQLAYTYILPKDAPKPEVDVQLGDQYQDTVSTFVGNIYSITVTAENGRSRTYTITFETERSNDATLAAILCGGKAIDLQPDVYEYVVALPYGTTTLPLVTYERKDNQQVIVTVSDNTVYLAVTAEDGVTQVTYTLTFEQGKSSNGDLAIINIDGEPLADFKKDLYEYNILLPYGTTELPQVTAELADSTATMTQETDGMVVTISTTSADESTSYDYVVIFTIDGCPINYLTDLTVKGTTIEGFDKDSTIYTIAYAFGTDSTAFIHAEDVAYVPGHETETITVSEEDGTILVTVKAENGDVRVYAIIQELRKSSNCLLKDIMLNGVTIANFADSVFNYEYLLIEGEVVPMIDAVAQDSLAEVSVTPGAVGEPTFIYCTAQDGSENVYAITFRVSPINPALEARMSDVLLKQIAGTDQFAAFSIRVNTNIAVYDQYGHLFFTQPLPVCNPNDVTVATDAAGREILTDAHGDGAYFTIPVHGQVFFYMFYSNNQRICSGKFMVQ